MNKFDQFVLLVIAALFALLSYWLLAELKETKQKLQQCEQLDY